MRARALVLACLLPGCGQGSSPNATDLSGDAGTASDMASAAGPTYASFAQTFFTKYCVSCHPSSSSTRDFTQYAVIKTNAHDIACGVSPTALAGCSGNPAPSQFPIGNGPAPTDDERKELVAWIQSGLPR